MTTVSAIGPNVGTRLADMLDVLGRTSDALVAIGPDMKIVGWNDAATSLLGYSSEEALGQPCYDILCWRDRCGDAVCDGSCPASEVGAPDELIDTKEVIGRSGQGNSLWLSASTIVPPIEMRDECRLIHLIREISLPPELERVIVERLNGWSPAIDPAKDHLAVLTPREREVLQLLTEGLDGAAIADQLYLSQATVRNHIQHILSKLGVHSRVEAVAYALRG